jgi:hypothetical protein
MALQDWTKEELTEGIKAMESLIGKCEKAEDKIVFGTSQWTTLSRRLKAFRMAHSLLSEKLAQLGDEECFQK